MFIIFKTDYLQSWLLYKSDVCISTVGNHKQVVSIELLNLEKLNYFAEIYAFQR